MNGPKLTREDYEAYALGVLRDEVREEIDRRLAEGELETIAAVAEADSLVAALAYAAPEADPPEHVKRQLLERIAPEARKPAPAPIRPKEAEAAEQPPPPRQPARRGFPALPWAVAAALLLFAVLTHYRSGALKERIAELEQQSSQLQSANQQLEAEAELYRRAMAIVAAPDTRPVALEAPGSPRIRAYWREGEGLLIAASSVPSVDEGRTYQLWILPRQGNPVGAGTFQPDENSRVLAIVEPVMAIGEANALAITNEPAGGSPQPTTQPIWVGPLG